MRDFVEGLQKELEVIGQGQTWLASKSGLAKTTINNWFTRGSRPNVMDALRASQALGRTIEDIVGISPEPRTKLRRDIDQMLDRLEDSDLDPIYDLAVGQAFRRARMSAPAPSLQLLQVQDRDATYTDDDYGPVVVVPLYGAAAAGRPIDLTADPGETYRVPASYIRGRIEDYFALRVRGTSMVQAGVHDGDVALMRRAEVPIHGQIMLVRNGDGSTLKRIRMEEGRVYLCWEDGSGRREAVTSAEYEVQGLMISVSRPPALGR